MKKLHYVLVLILAAVCCAPLNLYSQTKPTQPDTLGTDTLSKHNKELFVKNCSMCHGAKGQGDYGPNLTDDNWIHGSSAKNIRKSIENGMPGKGMIAWTQVFSPKEIQEIFDYVISLHGTNPSKAKKPEGEPNEELKKQ